MSTDVTADASERYLAAYVRSHRFTLGAPHSPTVAEDGSRVLFLRSGGPTDHCHRLWVVDTANGDTVRLPGPAPASGGYATDPAATVVVYPDADGALCRVDVDSGAVSRLPAGPRPGDPRPDPTGRHVAYLAGGALRVTGPGGDRALLVPDGPAVCWGGLEPLTADEFPRTRGHWWDPDGERLLVARIDTGPVEQLHLTDPADPDATPRRLPYPAAGTRLPEVSLQLVGLDGTRRNVAWDGDAFPYLASVQWAAGRPILLLVVDRAQRRGLVLAVDPESGGTRTLTELAAEHWIQPVPGVPRWAGDGSLVHVGDCRDTDTRRLYVDGRPVTPSGMQVHRVDGDLDGDVVVAAGLGDPAECHLVRVPTDGGPPHRLTTGPGWHSGLAAGGALVVCADDLSRAAARWSVRTAKGEHRLANLAALPPYRSRPVLSRVTSRRIPAAVVYPRGHRPGRRLPVLVHSYGGPGQQEIRRVRDNWLNRQWWADQGYAVVTVDGRGTPGVSPGWEQAIAGGMAEAVLADQVDALHALAERDPDLDLGRVGIRGWSFGGWLAALAVLRRPDVFHAACAGAPVTDWLRYSAAYTERHLGWPAADGYPADSLVPVDGPLRRPLAVVHGTADDNVLPAHALRLSAELHTHGGPYVRLSLPGTRHIPAPEVAARLWRWERAFFRQALSRPSGFLIRPYDA